jgi:hypothetical protein
MSAPCGDQRNSTDHVANFRVKVPIKDKCPGCAKDTVDLSLPAFKKLEKPEVGRAKGAQVKIVSC